jgi:hypothetical protein
MPSLSTGVMNEWQAEAGITLSEFVAVNPGLYAPAPRTVWVGGYAVEVPNQKALIATMARLMADGQAVAGACTEDHLIAAGFTRAELRDLGEKARVLARHYVEDHQVDGEPRAPRKKRSRR